LDYPLHFSAHGKFLITGEYAVLDGIPGLAVPLKLDQRLSVELTNDNVIRWQSYNDKGERWIDIETSHEELILKRGKDMQSPIAKRLAMVLCTARDLCADFSFPQGFRAKTELDFDQYAGMGTSSTLVSLVSQWVGCDPFKLQFACFGGSGYDVACARVNHPIIYHYNDGQPIVQKRFFDPLFEESLFCVYLNRKQNSRESIAQFDKSKLTDDLRAELRAMPDHLISASLDKRKFCILLERHEQIISKLIGMAPIKQELFPDFPGTIKSLGGWGGDFVLVVADQKEKSYFIEKGYTIIYDWGQIVHTGE
jgi:mevalonate kinase